MEERAAKLALLINAEYNIIVNHLITLFRPVGPKELELIRASGNRAFPPRLPE